MTRLWQAGEWLCNWRVPREVCPASKATGKSMRKKRHYSYYLVSWKCQPADTRYVTFDMSV